MTYLFCFIHPAQRASRRCMLEYGNITAFCHWFKKYYEIGFDSKIAAYASFGFDASMMDVYGAIVNGAELHIIPEEIRLDFIGLNNYFEENGITNAFMTTQVGRQFPIVMVVLLIMLLVDL